MEAPYSAGEAGAAGGWRGLEFSSDGQRDLLRPVERLDALTSGTAMSLRRADWFDSIREALEEFFSGVQRVLARDDLTELARGKRPDLLPAIDVLRGRLVLVLEEAWDLVYLLRRLSDAAEISDVWLGQRLRQCVHSYIALRRQATQLLSEIVWSETAKPGATGGG